MATIKNKIFNIVDLIVAIILIILACLLYGATYSSCIYWCGRLFLSNGEPLQLWYNVCIGLGLSVSFFTSFVSLGIFILYCYHSGKG